MTTYTQIGGVTIDAIQWNGPPLVMSALPIWLRNLPIVVAGLSLCVPIGITGSKRGTVPANIGDWIFLSPNGDVSVVSNAYFVALYH
jgi:hypothetical protein